MDPHFLFLNSVDTHLIQIHLLSNIHFIRSSHVSEDSSIEKLRGIFGISKIVSIKNKKCSFVSVFVAMSVSYTRHSYKSGKQPLQAGMGMCRQAERSRSDSAKTAALWADVCFLFLPLGTMQGGVQRRKCLWYFNTLSCTKLLHAIKLSIRP